MAHHIVEKIANDFNTLFKNRMEKIIPLIHPMVQTVDTSMFIE
jgi:hypothetical protein